MASHVIPIRADAPPKPDFGAPCNGCGVCCLAAPCPVSSLLLAHRRGACPALVWQDTGKLYRCGMLQAPSQHSRWLPAWLDPVVIAFARRWLALDIGCDASLKVDDIIADKFDDKIDNTTDDHKINK